MNTLSSRYKLPPPKTRQVMNKNHNCCFLENCLVLLFSQFAASDCKIAMRLIVGSAKAFGEVGFCFLLNIFMAWNC